MAAELEITETELITDVLYELATAGSAVTAVCYRNEASAKLYARRLLLREVKSLARELNKRDGDVSHGIALVFRSIGRQKDQCNHYRRMTDNTDCVKQRVLREKLNKTIIRTAMTAGRFRYKRSSDGQIMKHPSLGKVPFIELYPLIERMDDKEEMPEAA